MHPSRPLPPPSTPRRATRRGPIAARPAPARRRIAHDDGGRIARMLLARALQALLFVALVAMASLPQARTVNETFGWLPLWLLAIPSAAWLALWAATRFGEAARAPAARVARRPRTTTAPVGRPRVQTASRHAPARAAA